MKLTGYKLSLLVICLSTASCSNKQEVATVAGKKGLAGHWSNLAIRLEMDKKHGEPTSIYEVDSTNWEQELQMHVIETSFNEDGTFVSPHYNLSDSLVLDQKGIWSADESELTMITQSPFADTTVCSYTINGDLATFECWVDWDQDGAKDDLYIGVQRKTQNQ